MLAHGVTMYQHMKITWSLNNFGAYLSSRHSSSDLSHMLKIFERGLIAGMARRQPPPPPPPCRTTATTPTSRIYVDCRNIWSPIEQENVTFDKGTLFDGPYQPKERLMDRDRVTQLVTQDDNFDDFGDHISDGLHSPLRGSSMYNQHLNEYQLHDNYSG